MRSRIVEYIVEYGKLPTGYQQEIMDYSWGFTYGFRPILPQIVEALFVRAAMLFTSDAFSLLFAGRLSSVLCGLVFAGYVRAIARKLFDRSGSTVAVYAFDSLSASGRVFVYLSELRFHGAYGRRMIVWYLLRGMEDGFSVPTCLKLAVSFSICILSYYNAYGFLITGAVVFFGYYLEKSRRGERRWKEFWKKGLLILGGRADFVGLVVCTELFPV